MNKQNKEKEESSKEKEESSKEKENPSLSKRKKKERWSTYLKKYVAATNITCQIYKNISIKYWWWWWWERDPQFYFNQ